MQAKASMVSLQYCGWMGVVAVGMVSAWRNQRERAVLCRRRDLPVLQIECQAKCAGSSVGGVFCSKSQGRSCLCGFAIALKVACCTAARKVVQDWPADAR